MADEQPSLFSPAGLLKLFGAALMGRLMARGDQKRRLGSHPRQPINFRQHKPAGSKLRRKVARNMGHGLWG